MKQSLSVPEVLAEQKGWDEKYLGAVIHSIHVSDNDAAEKQDLTSFSAERPQGCSRQPIRIPNVFSCRT